MGSFMGDFENEIEIHFQNHILEPIVPGRQEL
jgi:hypothetical protein